MLGREIMDAVNAELDGLYGADFLRDLRENIRLYEIYEGDGGFEEPPEYEPARKRTNFIKKLIKEEARFLFGKTPEATVYSADAEAAEKLRRYLDGALAANSFSERLIKAARDCFVGKRVALVVGAEPGEEVCFSFRPSPEFVFDYAQGDPDRVTKAVFVHAQSDTPDRKRQRVYRQKFEMAEGRCLVSEGIFDGFGEPVEIRYDKADTGLGFMPVIIIRNDGQTGDHKGESDVAPLKELQRIYDGLTSDDADALKFNMFPQTVAMNVDEESLNNIRIAPAALIDAHAEPAGGDGETARIYKLESAFNYDSRMENALNRIKSEMHELLSIPVVTPEELTGYMASGKAMKAVYWQMVTRCEEKWTTWRPALEWLCLTILKVAEAAGRLEVKIPEDLTVKVDNVYPLMDDEYEEKDSDMRAVAAGVMSRKSYMKKWDHKLGEEGAERELEQIARERGMLQGG
ncbi:MAG: phage portal protein [Firmicutes bacterium]|nr:phage portal protein [Bacillota bacterium]